MTLIMIMPTSAGWILAGDAHGNDADDFYGQGKRMRKVGIIANKFSAAISGDWPLLDTGEIDVIHQLRQGSAPPIINELRLMVCASA